jgi:hypothetical protein
MDQRGEEAAAFAAGRADEFLKEGDVNGALVWRRILATHVAGRADLTVVLV